MSWESDKAGELLELAAQRLAEGKAQMAGATLCRAFDVLDRAPAGDPEIDGVRLSILEQLYALRSAADTASALQERLPRSMPLLANKPDLARRLVGWFAIEREESGPDALEVYVRFLESGAAGDTALGRKLHEILSRNLVIHLSTPEDASRALVPLLERLHRLRPSLAYPRLYLGRWHYLGDRYREAWDLLDDLQGPLAERPKVLNVLARCAEKLGRKEEALSLYERSLEQNDQQPNIHYRAARLLVEGAQREAPLDAQAPGVTPTAETPLQRLGR